MNEFLNKARPIWCLWIPCESAKSIVHSVFLSAINSVLYFQDRL